MPLKECRFYYRFLKCMRSGKADRLTLGKAKMPVQDGLAVLTANPSPHQLRPL